MRVTFLFWNLGHRPIEARIAAIARDLDIKVLILAECSIRPDAMLAALQARDAEGFAFPFDPTGQEGDIRVFIRFSASSLEPVYDDVNNHIAIRRLRVPECTDLLLVIVHAQSKLHWRDSSQSQFATRLPRRIEEFEKRLEHQRTVLVGDLNMNPWEDGVVGSEALHAVMTRRIANGRAREVDAVSRPFFYNPMWRFLGDRDPVEPPGTFFLAKAEPVTYFWNMFDQVLLRPDLIESLRTVKIIREVGALSLLDDMGRPNPAVGSDHLPLFFELEI